MVQPLPDGQVSATAKIEVDELTEELSTGRPARLLRRRQWASVHMIIAGGQRDLEFIYESEGNP